MVFVFAALGPVFGPVHGAAELAASFVAASAFASAAVQTPAALAVDALTVKAVVETIAEIATATRAFLLIFFTYLP
jgi:hypothetical protein